MSKKTPAIDIKDNGNVIIELHKNNESCFEAIYYAYFEKLCIYASRYVLIHTAKEVVQDAFMHIWEQRHTLNPQLSLKSLLFVIVKNKALDQVSHCKIIHKVHSAIYEKFQNGSGEYDTLTYSDFQDKFKQSVAKLPNTYRKTFEMHSLGGMSYSDIAHKLGVSVPTVNYRLVQAVKILRNELKDFMP